MDEQGAPRAAGAPKAGAGMAGTPNPPGAAGCPKAGGGCGEAAPGAAPKPRKAGAALGGGALNPGGDDVGGVVGVPVWRSVW